MWTNNILKTKLFKNALQSGGSFKILARCFSVDGKLLLCFQSKNAVFKFNQRSVDGALAKQSGIHHRVIVHSLGNRLRGNRLY